MLQAQSSLLDQVKLRQVEFLREVEYDRLVEEAKQPKQQSERSGLRQQLGQSLVRLGQHLMKEPELA